jgi:hypothetical protein
MQTREIFHNLISCEIEEKMLLHIPSISLPHDTMQEEKAEEIQNLNANNTQKKLQICFDTLYQLCKPANKTKYAILEKTCQTVKRLDHEMQELIHTIAENSPKKSIKSGTIPMAQLSKDGNILNFDSEFQILFCITSINEIFSLFKFVDDEYIQKWFSAFSILCRIPNQVRTFRSSFLKGKLECECSLQSHTNYIQLLLY